jgi:hypothetical protein
MAFPKSRIKETTLEDGNKIKTELRDIERWFEKQESLLTSKFMRYLNLKTLK